MSWFKKILLGVIAALLGLFILVLLLQPFGKTDPADIVWGANFSPNYAKHLGLDWKKAYTDILDEMQFSSLRLSTEWSAIEPERGKYDYSDLDWMIDQAEKRGVTVILAIGRKVPRWPECHDPAWVKGLSEDEIQPRVLQFIETTIDRYKDRNNIKAWQVENEPFVFYFGECPHADRGFLKQELQLVRSLDSRPIVMTESGELSTWIGAVRRGDILGISLYRIVWNNSFGFLKYPFWSGFYRGRANLYSPFINKVIVTELQTEAWAPGDIRELSVDQIYESMSPDQLKKNLEFAERAGFSEVYIWGPEWWAWLKEMGQPQIWDIAKQFFISR